MLFEVSGMDPFSFGVAFFVLSGAAIPASYLPARRAAMVSSTLALRVE